MLQFLKYVLATLVGLFLFFFLGFLMLVGIAVSTSTEDEITVAENSVLELRLDKPIVEREPKNPFAEMGFNFGRFRSAIGLDQIKASIKKAKADKNIQGIYLNIDLINAGMATLEEIRNDLIDFKKSGKFVVAYSEVCSEKSYYLASVADRLYLNPVGALELNGLSSEVLFFKGTLEKLGIKPYIFRVGNFKSAVEPFMLDKMSDSSRVQVSSFLNSLNNHMLTQVAKSRGKTFEELKRISDSMLVHNADDALKYGLVTHLGYYDEATSFMKMKAGIEEKDNLNLVQLEKYSKVSGNKEKVSKNQIAVIYANGDIVNGEGNDETIGGKSTAEAIRKARLDERVKAVVIRINSPGGSALASDVIWREVVLTKKVKPVIASMSDVAASGGYYIAMGCDTIVAQPNTITGSIGVFGIMANLEPFLRDKLGMTVDRVNTGRFSDVPTLTRNMTDFERQVIQKEVERIYEDFTRKAAEGRHMSQDELKRYASGRVWSGIEAKERGLVDVLGGLEDAVRLAAARAGIEDSYRLKYLPQQKNFLEELMGGLKDGTARARIQAELGEFYPYYESLQKLRQMEGIQARLPYDIEIQ